MASNDLAKQLSRFLSIYLPHERNASPNTVSAYRDGFISILLYLRDEKHIKAEKATLADINRDNVIGYLQWLIDKQGCSIATRNNRLAAVRSFVSYLQYDSVEYMDQWQRILAQPDTTDPMELRHLAILALMYDTGCRVQELADLTIESLRIQYKPCSIKIYGKGRKTRIVPLSEHVVDILAKYMDCYHIDMDIGKKNPLFWNSSRNKLTRAGITYILKKYAVMARMSNPNLIPEITSCHQLRHSRAMHLLQSGVNLVWIRDLLGHSTIQTTEIYARADSKQKREAIEKASENLTPSDVIGEWVDNNDLISWLKGLGKK